MAEGAILSVQGLSKSFGGLKAVSGLDLAISRGTILALIGPNGAGKSTAVNLIAGVIRPSAGAVLLEGEELAGRSSSHIARKGLVRTFQNGRLFHRLSVLENVLVGAHARYRTGLLGTVLRTQAARREEAATREIAMRLLAEVGLDRDAHRDVRELPYGKQRWLELARALILEPRVLMLDEPAAGLNSGEVEALIAYVNALRARGLSILLIEHNMGLVMRLADRICVLNFGERIAEGTPGDIRGDERVIEAYLGRKATHAAV